MPSSKPQLKIFRCRDTEEGKVILRRDSKGLSKFSYRRYLTLPCTGSHTFTALLNDYIF